MVITDLKKEMLPVMNISKLRINTDGLGIRTVVFSAECPLNCKYCINNECHGFPKEKITYLTTDDIYNELQAHRIYFWASGGGVTFGGGEPLLYEDFLLEFCKKFHQEIKIAIETSLNVSLKHLDTLQSFVSQFIVDIKDMNPDIYKKYTGKTNIRMLKNLQVLSGCAKKVTLRIPYIPNYNEKSDIEKSVVQLKNMGFTSFDIFEYTIRGY